MLKFEIASSRAVDVENEKKFVAYTLSVRLDVSKLDPDPINIERRYTHFLDLYNGLKKEYPSLLSTISFPRKMVTGNFDRNLILTRCTAFEALLKLIADEPRLRDTPAAIAFLQDIELNEAKRLINEKMYDQALVILENIFKLLNKVYTDRSRVVLCALCRVVACSEASGGGLAGPVERWAQLALRRYEGVSDSDLLALYVPLLHSCIAIWETLGRDKSRLVNELNDLRKRGMRVDSAPTLTEAVDSITSVL